MDVSSQMRTFIVERELSSDEEKESSRLKPKITHRKNEYRRNFELPSHYASDEPEILEVEFITLLVTLTISFIICAAVTFLLVWVSSIYQKTNFAEQATVQAHSQIKNLNQLKPIFKYVDHIITAREVSDLLKERKIEPLESSINSTDGLQISKIL